ncbi:MAG: collagen-binding protein [Acidobacteriales bacterium 59-55]|nr:TonB-dependent receptor [Terriglobales bacterium]OJV42380.1 MAG: collagen-binding protein [Acidobacteriales bacterium 59-55]
MRKKHLRLLGILSLSCLLQTAVCFAQFSGAVQGSVLDPSTNAIPAATVTIVNAGTQVTRTTTTDNSGVYRFASLAPGNYAVSAQASGFSTSKVTFTLQTGETRNVPVTLAVGQAVSSVTVTAQAPLLDTSDSRNQETLGTTALANLPMSTLNPTQLVTLAPGVTGLGAGTATSFNPENYVDASANGRGQNGNQYIVDGMDVTSNIRPGVLNLTPSADSISEMNIQTNTYNVDYGRASALQVVMTTKSGTDQYHGFASEYYTYQGLWAKSEFTHPAPGQPAYHPFHTNNMSFGIGGPVIPKHKFFFFFAIEPYRSVTSNGTSLQTYEDPAFVSFAQQVRPDSPEVQLMTKYAPENSTFVRVASTAQDAFGPQNLGNNTGCETPSTDNIPCSTPVFDNGNFNSTGYNNSKQYNLRLDKYFSKDRLYGNFFRNTISSGSPNIRPAFTTTNLYYGSALQVNETHDFSANTLNEAIFGYNRIEGFSPATGLFTVPVVSVTGLGPGWGNGFAQGDYIQHSYHWRDVLTHIHGSHQFKFGYEGWHGSDVAIFAGAYGQPNLHYNNMIDLINDNPYSSTGMSYNIVTGEPQAGNYYFGMTIGGGFAEDTWKVNQRLTLNYGLRYDNNGNAYPIRDGILANFHRGSGSSFSEQIANGIMKKQSHTLNHDMNWIFSPRLGVSYDPTGHGVWVVRGGIGLFHDLFTQGNAENGLRGNPPYWTVPTFYNNGSTAKPVFSYGNQNHYPFGFTYPAFQGTPLDAKGGIVGSQISVGGVDVNLSSPNTYNYSVALERQITSNMTASVGYVGSHSDNLVTNGGSTNATSYGMDVNSFAGDLIQHPNFDGNGNYTGSGTQTRLNTSFGALSYAMNGPRSNYNAFIATVRGRFANRGFLTSSYTRATSKDNWQNYPLAQFDQYYGPSPWDVRNRFSLGSSYELPGLNQGSGLLGRVSSGWTMSGTVILQSGVPYTVYTGQALSINTIASDGQPLTSSNYSAEAAAGHLQFNPGSGDFNGDGDNLDYPNVSSYHTGHTRKDYLTGVFPRCSAGNLNGCGPFTLPAVGSNGNEKVNQFNNPGFAETDFTLKKVTRITERFTLDLRVDAFNLFNRVNLGSVDSNAQDSNFGTSTSISANPRNFQLAGRLNF